MQSTVLPSSRFWFLSQEIIGICRNRFRGVLVPGTLFPAIIQGRSHQRTANAHHDGNCEPVNRDFSVQVCSQPKEDRAPAERQRSCAHQGKNSQAHLRAMVVRAQAGKESAQQEVSRNDQESPAGHNAFQTHNMHNFESLVA